MEVAIAVSVLGLMLVPVSAASADLPRVDPVQPPAEPPPATPLVVALPVMMPVPTALAAHLTGAMAGTTTGMIVPTHHFYIEGMGINGVWSKAVA